MSAQATSKTVADYGTWGSPITADLLTQKNVSFGDIAVLRSSHDHAVIAYVESRPDEGGRAALVSLKIPLGARFDDAGAQGEPVELSRGELNVRTGVHEYGGGAAARAIGDKAVLTDYKTFKVYNAAADGGSLDQISSDNKALRFADFSHHPTLPYIAAICEDHTVDEPSRVVNTIAVIDAQTKEVYTIATGHDFYSSPRFSPDGKYIAWVSWDHPSMPFWATEVWVAKFEASEGREPRAVHAMRADGNNDSEVAHYPLWLGHERLMYCRDKSGYSNPYTVTVSATDTTCSIEKKGPLLQKSVEADFTLPAWQVNNSTYDVLNKDWLVCALAGQSFASLALLHIPSGELKTLKMPFVSLNQLRVVSDSAIVFVGVQETEPSALVAMDLGDCLSGQNDRPRWRIIKRSSNVVADGKIAGEYLGRAERIEFPTELPDGTKATAHALLFPPSNPQYVAPAGASPPCILKIHGGPTSCSSPGANLGISYWTSRGYSLCMVNYGGSTSYGRKFMERLNGQWGVVDVRDAAAAASFLGTSGSADRIAKSTRRITTKAQNELDQLQIEDIPGGGVEYVLKRTPSLLDWACDVGVAGAVGAVATYFGFAAFLPSLAALLTTAGTRVQEESVTVLPGMGLQVGAKRGLGIPSLKRKAGATSRFIKTTESQKLVPRDCILDVFTKESFNRWRVIDYLALATTDTRPVSDGGKGKVKSNAALTVLFPQLRPRLPVVETVYRGIYTSLFGAPNKKVKQDQPRVDPDRIAISGGSAGGFTVLASLCLYPSVFKAGTSLYGVSRIVGLAESSHKFESEYVNRLMGGPPDKIPQVYHDRSPLYMADRIRAPVILMQGDIDKVVPPEQSEAIYDVLQKQGVKTKYIVFEGEGHGFRKAENIKRALHEEETWYRDVFKL